MLCASNPGKDACQGDSGGDSDESSDDDDVNHYEIDINLGNDDNSEFFTRTPGD